MVTLKPVTKAKAMHYLAETVNSAKYDMDCYEEGTAEHEKEKERYEALNTLYMSMQNIAENKEL